MSVISQNKDTKTENWPLDLGWSSRSVCRNVGFLSGYLCPFRHQRRNESRWWKVWWCQHNKKVHARRIFSFLTRTASRHIRKARNCWCRCRCEWPSLWSNCWLQWCPVHSKTVCQELGAGRHILRFHRRAQCSRCWPSLHLLPLRQRKEMHRIHSRRWINQRRNSILGSRDKPFDTWQNNWIHY